MDEPLRAAIAHWVAERNQLSADEETAGLDPSRVADLDLVDRWEQSDDEAAELLRSVHDDSTASCCARSAST
jgi:hypothetical protein